MDKTLSDPGLAESGTREARLLSRLDASKIPRHVAVIMDGNGRWAAGRGLPRSEGHRAGARAVREIVETSARLGVEVLTLYAFSTENWKRPQHEVWLLMNLLKEYLRREVPSLIEQGVKLRLLGRWRELAPALVRQLEKAVEATSAGQSLVLNIALNYSGRCEIVDACRQIVSDWGAGQAVEIDEGTLSRYLSTSGQPDPDLMIRTSGELRISNFLLWQLAYSEIHVTSTLWPDFGRAELFEALIDFQGRNRRFGGLVENQPNDEQSSSVSGRT